MSIALPIEEDPRFRRYTASHGQKVFAIPFPFQQDADISIQLYADGIYSEIDRTLFAISGAMDPQGGSVTFHSGRVGGEVVVIVGAAILERLSSVVKDGRFASKVTDDEFDRNRIIQQEQRRDLERALKFDFGLSFAFIQAPQDGASLIWKKLGAFWSITNGPNVWDEYARLSREIEERKEADAGITLSVLREEIARIAGDLATASLIGQAGPVELATFDTTLAASLANIKASTKAVITSGRALPGDGDGGVFRDVTVTPLHKHWFKSLDGAIWEKIRDVKYSRLEGDKLQIRAVYPIDEQPVLARWDFSQCAAGSVSDLAASMQHPSATVSVLTQVNGTNTVGVRRNNHPYGTTPVGGTDQPSQSSLNIGFNSLSDTLVASSMAYQFSITAPANKVIAFQDLRFDLGYDSQLDTWYDVRARLYLSDDGVNWTAFGNEASLGDKSAFYSSFTAEDAGGGYFFKKDNPSVITDGNNTHYINPGSTKYFRLALAKGQGVSASNRRRLVLSNLQLDGTAFDVVTSALHGIVSREAGWFYGWVANGARSQWGDRIQISSEKGVWVDNPDGHDIDYSTDFWIFHTTEDGGFTWVDSVKPNVLIPADITSTIPRVSKDFLHAAFGMILRDNYCWWTYDKGENWIGPSAISGQTVQSFYARTSFIITGPQSALMFMTGARRSPAPGQSTRNRSIVYSTIDGGLTWQLVNVIGNEDFFNSVASQYSAYSIMPVAVCTGPNRFVVAVRELWRTHKWIAIYSTDDNFKTTKLIARVGQDAENPPAMVQLPNGEIWLMYCNRQNGPKGLVAQVSRDGGYSWSVPVYLRTDGVDWDCGYPSAFVRPDGRILVCYYWHTAEMPHQYVARTIFNPAELNPAIGPEYSGPKREYTFLNRI